MGNRLIHDVEVKEQLVVVCIVATVITVFESYMYFRIIMPDVLDHMQWLLRPQNRRPLDGDPVLRDAIHCTLSFADRREQPVLRANNAAAILNAVLIALLPVLVVSFLYALSPQLRHVRKRAVIIDVMTVLFGIGMFEIVFYRYGRQWTFPSLSEMIVDVCRDYRAEAVHNVPVDVRKATDSLLQRLRDSPTLRKARETQGQGVALMTRFENIASRINTVTSGSSPLQTIQEGTEALDRVATTAERSLDAATRARATADSTASALNALSQTAPPAVPIPPVVPITVPRSGSYAVTAPLLTSPFQ